jgi:hypothetical protein
VHGKIRTVLNDILFLCLLGLAVIIFAMIFHLNPPGKKQVEEVKSPGQLSVEVRWFPDDLNCDVDLWVKSPGDRPVGYSNLRGKLFNLVRDDLGHGRLYNDYLGLNYENAYTRGLVPGEYVVNVHMYRCPRSKMPVNVKVLITLVHKKDKTSIFTGEVTLTRQGEEITVDRFTLDEQNRASNHHAVFTPLRTAGPAQ